MAIRSVAFCLACLLPALAAANLSGCSDFSRGHYRVTSLLDRPLPPMELAPEERAKRVMDLAAARRDLELHPGDEDKIIWLGRRTAYLGRYSEAIDIFTDGLRRYPESYRMLRHRGHRLLTVRRLDDAVRDLERAADMIVRVPDVTEPDGLPNRLNRPTSTSHTNIYYHLGLAHYLLGDYESALDAYLKCMLFSKNNDMICATSYWQYLTLRRLGRDQEATAVLAPITADMEIIENVAYHRLLRMFKGELSSAQVLESNSDDREPIDDATVGYGVGAWHLLNGEHEAARSVFVRIVRGPAWPAFGHIAAEAELAEWGGRFVRR